MHTKIQMQGGFSHLGYDAVAFLPKCRQPVTQWQSLIFQKA